MSRLDLKKHNSILSICECFFLRYSDFLTINDAISVFLFFHFFQKFILIKKMIMCILSSKYMCITHVFKTLKFLKT
jgi:hypothetical protein